MVERETEREGGGGEKRETNRQTDRHRQKEMRSRRRWRRRVYGRSEKQINNKQSMSGRERVCVCV